MDRRNRGHPMPQFEFDFAFIRNRYDYELQRKEQLTSALTLPVGVLGGLGSLLAVMARTFSYEHPVLTWFFVPVLVLALVAFFGCLVQLARAYHRQTYVFLPLLSKIDESREEFLGFAPVIAGGVGEVLEEFEKQMRGRMINAADRNTQTNDERSKLLHQAREWLFALLLLTATTGIPYVLDHLRMLVMPRQTTTTEQPAPAPAPTNQTPQLPTVPPNREIREGSGPTERG